MSEARKEKEIKPNLEPVDLVVDYFLTHKFYKDENEKVVISLDGVDGNNYQNLEIYSRKFSNLVNTKFKKITGKYPKSRNVVDTIIYRLDCHGANEGQRKKFQHRAIENDDCIQLALYDEKNRFIEIYGDGFEYKFGFNDFKSPSGSLPLGEVAENGSWELLGKYINTRDRESLMLVCVSIVSWLFTSSPQLILLLGGPQGAGKSVTSRVIKSIFDPSQVLLKSLPAKVDDLIITLGNGLIHAFDNISFLSTSMSDVFCRNTSGGAMAVRKLYNDSDEYTRCSKSGTIMNGISDFAKNSDFLSRAVVIPLVKMENDKRRTEAEIFKELESDLPKIRRGLIDLTSSIIKNIPSVKMERAPRMADFSKVGIASEVFFNLEPGSFLRIYESNLCLGTQDLLNDNTVVGQLRSIVKEQGFWLGTATELHQRCSDSVLDTKLFPRSPSNLSRELKKLEDSLHLVGIGILFERKANVSREKIIKFVSLGLGHFTSPSPVEIEKQFRAKVSGVEGHRTDTLVLNHLDDLYGKDGWGSINFESEEF